VGPAPFVAPGTHNAPVHPAALQPSTAPLGLPQSACRGSAHFEHPLLATARRLASGEPLTIVAIGSSSTAGTGASSPAATYPGRLAIELRRRWPGHSVTVFNRGVGGEETDKMLARFASGVLAVHPQLVLWQVGTNSVLRNHPVAPHSELLRKGIAELKAIGADVVLIDMQYAPKVLAKPGTPLMTKLIELSAHEDGVDLFHRFAAMQGWYQDQHHSFDGFISRDGLHMNDWGYACWAKLLATAIAEAANRPSASAALQPAP
jgi:lysophospholipase L1-like esterase